MSFLIQFQPASKLSFMMIGYLFFHVYVSRMLSFEVWILLGVSFGFCIHRGYLKVASILLGTVLSLASITFFKSETPDTNFREIHFESLKNQTEIQIHFKKEVKRNFYESEIHFNQKTFNIIVKRFKKDIVLPSLLCNSNQIFLKKVSPTQEYFRFLHTFDYSYLQIQESKCKLLAEKIDPRKKIRKHFEDMLTRAKITDTANDIAMGLFFGDASYLENEFKEKVRQGGILHLFAASGLHIGVFIAFLYFFAKQIWFLNYYTERIFPLLIAFSYLFLLNFPVSLLRAYIFASILIIGNLFFRKMKSIDLILISSGLILLFDRENFLTLSFTLSYSAVCGILFFKKHLDSLLFGKWKNAFSENFTISMSANLGTFPVLVFYFKTFSFGSIFLNLLLVPLTSLLLPILYLCILIQIVYEFLSERLYTILIEITNQTFCKESLLLKWIWNFANLVTETVWTYSELLLRTLAFLSEQLSHSLGFFRSVKESYFFHMTFYAGFIFILVFLFFSLDFFPEKKEKTKKRRVLFSIFAFFTIGSFFYFGYVLYPEKNLENSYSKKISAGSDYYLVKEKNAIYLGGICKYSQFQIKQILKQNFCDESIESIFIEEETCLTLANICKKNTVGAKIYSSKKWQDWENVYSHLEMNPKASNRKFSNLIVFYPHLDSLSGLQKNSKTDNGNILLLFAYKLNDNAKDWNTNKNLLGINPNWNFITTDEL